MPLYIRLLPKYSQTTLLYTILNKLVLNDDETKIAQSVIQMESSFDPIIYRDIIQ